MRSPFQGEEISKKCGKDDPEIAQNNFKSIFMTDKKIKYVDVTVDLPVKLIESLERRFEKKELIDKFGRLIAGEKGFADRRGGW